MLPVFKILSAISGMAFFSVTMASDATTTAAGSAPPQPLMVIQVVQSQMMFDPSMIQSATIVSPTNPSDDSYGVHIKLTATAANQLGNLSQGNIGKNINMIVNGNLISSPILQSNLGGDFIVSGLTNAEAMQFLSSIPSVH